MAELLPEPPVFSEPEGDSPEAYALSNPHVTRFALSYKTVDFGWHIAQQLAKYEIRFPSILHGDDVWVERCYWHLRNRRNRDSMIERAIGYRLPSMEAERNILHALLVSKDDLDDVATVEELKEKKYDMIAHYMRTDVPVIKAYAQLFFNVIDRKVDEIHIAQTLYPHTRFVEMYNRYVTDESLYYMLLRAGYNNGHLHVLYFAGFPNGLLHSIQPSDAVSKFEALTMTNGYVLALNGFMNQSPDNAPGLSHARHVLQAGKIGGEGTATTSPLAEAGPILLHEMMMVRRMPNAPVTIDIPRQQTSLQDKQ